MKIENKTVLITGGAGFIGSNLCEVLLKQNNNVICLDNFITGKKVNIKPFISNSRFKLIEGDIRNFNKLTTNRTTIFFHFNKSIITFWTYDMSTI